MSKPPQLPGVPEARRDPRLRRFPLRRLRVPIGAGQTSLVVPDEQVWRRRGTWTADVTRGKEPPYWIRIWPAALAVARTLMRLRGLDGYRVLDLGCGLGLPGVVAAGAGARVTFADVEPDALAFAAWNARQQPGCVHDPTPRLVDWSRDVVDGLFDLIVLSDVSYHGKHHAPLRRHLAAALGRGGAALHADPHRELSDEFLGSLTSTHATAHTTTRTTIQDRCADVRLTWIAADRAALGSWLDAAQIRHTNGFS